MTLASLYTSQSGRLLLNGTQALVRLLFVQKLRDLAAGVNTAGFVSGYRGSPLAGLDMALEKAQTLLKEHNIVFQSGLNEEIGATSVWGTQQVELFQEALYEGVFSLWYGKGPGVDRSMDAFKHANAAGSSKNGGVLVLSGDDHACKSSSLPHQSEFAFVDAMIPILHPSSVEEILRFGILGWAMSRFSGCWVNLKLVSDVVDTTATIILDDVHFPIFLPKQPLEQGLPVHMRWPDLPLDQEKRLWNLKLPAAQAFAYLNHIDRILTKTEHDVCGIITTGKAYLHVREALSDLGLNESLLEEYGIRLYKVGLTWPLEPKRLKEFADNLKVILVVEEKRPLIEAQAKDILFGQNALKIMGKKNLNDEPLLQSTGTLDTQAIGKAILLLLAEAQIKPIFFRKEPPEKEFEPQSLSWSMKRIPYYCSGCPHNISTKTLERSKTLAGIGCHYMAMWIDPSTMTFTQMGAEGTNWIGLSSFTKMKHVFANMGDGTYSHSGSLAIRAAVAAGVNITYKILLNDAVAMTGGQLVEAKLSASSLSYQLCAEGVKHIAVVTDNLRKYPAKQGFAPHTQLYHRSQLKDVEGSFRQIPGVTAIIYDQVCAAEKRRRGKKEVSLEKEKRVFINEHVCEGCGDCNQQSQCLSVIPHETELGRKRAIDQSSCNKDFSCIDGFCPSFILVEGGKYKPSVLAFDYQNFSLPNPPRSIFSDPEWAMVIAGIGGTGIVTAGAFLAKAACIEGKSCTVLDMTGLSQKGGAVTTHIKISALPQATPSAIAKSKAHLILAADALVAASGEVLCLLNKNRTTVVFNTKATATGGFTHHKDEVIPVNFIAHQLKDLCHVFDALNFTQASQRLLGDTLSTNVILLGYAYQKGWLPLCHQSIEEAIRQHSLGVEANLKAFFIGRRLAADPHWAQDITQSPKNQEILEALEDKIQYRVGFLAAYQDKAYAEQYLHCLTKVKTLEKKIGLGTKLTEAVTNNLFKLMAYKDEYEVARLYTQTPFLQSIKEQITGNFKISFYLSPPLWAPKSKGIPIKIKFGSWVFYLFKILAKAKRLRGTFLDPFGHTHERRLERQMIIDYKALIEYLITKLQLTCSYAQYEHAVQMAKWPEKVSGFGHIRKRSIEQAEAYLRQLKQQYDDGVDIQNVCEGKKSTSQV